VDAGCDKACQQGVTESRREVCFAEKENDAKLQTPGHHSYLNVDYLSPWGPLRHSHLEIRCSNLRRVVVWMMQLASRDPQIELEYCWFLDHRRRSRGEQKLDCVKEGVSYSFAIVQRNRKGM